MAVLVSDNAVGTNTGNINGRTLNNALGGSLTRTYENFPGNKFGILDDEFLSQGTAAAALIDDLGTSGKQRIRFRFTTNDSQACLFALVSNVRYGPGIAGLVYSRTSLQIHLLDNGSRYGTAVATQSMSQLSLDTNYILEMEKVGSVVTLTVYLDDGTTVHATTSYDFTSTVFTNTFHGFSNYELENVYFKNYIFETAEANPPTIEIDDFYPDGPDVVIDFTATSEGSSPEVEATIEKDGVEISPKPSTTNVMGGELRLTNPGPGEYELIELTITDSIGDDSDGPWPDPVEILGLGGTEIQGSLTKTLGTLLLSSSGEIQGSISGSLVKTLGDLVLSSGGSVTKLINGEVTATLGSLGLIAEGHVGVAPPPPDPSAEYTLGGPYLTIDLKLTVS